jgi:hypothetical protein
MVLLLGCAVRFRLKRNEAKFKLFSRMFHFEAKHWKSKAIQREPSKKKKKSETKWKRKFLKISKFD